VQVVMFDEQSNAWALVRGLHLSVADSSAVPLVFHRRWAIELSVGA